MNNQLVTEHVLMSLLPWLAGILVGGGVGSLVGVGLVAALSASASFQWIWALIPWRTAVMGALAFIWTGQIIVERGLGATTGGLMVGWSVFVLAVPMMMKVLINQRFSASVPVRFIESGRSLLTGAVVFAQVAGSKGGGGLGLAIYQSLAFRPDDMKRSIFAVVSIILVFDVLLGVVQMLMLRSHIQHTAASRE